MFEAFEGFITVSVPIAVGYLVARSGLLTARTGVELNRLAVTVLMPVLLFTILSEAEPSTLFSHLALVSLLAAVAMFALYVLLAGLFWRRGAGELAVGAMAAGYTNANNIGLPIALHMLGDPTLVAPIVLFQTGVFAPVGLTILAVGARRRGGGGRGRMLAGDGLDGLDGAGGGDGCDAAAGPRDAAGGGNPAGPPVWKVVGGAVLNPIVVGSLGGLAVSVSAWEIPAMAMDPIELIGGGAIPIMLIAFGMSLRGRPLLAPGGGRAQVLTASALKLFAMPAVAFLLAKLVFDLSPAEVYAVTVLAALPTAQNVFNYALRYDTAVILARDTVSVTTLGAAPLVFMLAALFGPV